MKIVCSIKVLAKTEVSVPEGVSGTKARHATALAETPAKMQSDTLDRIRTMGVK